MLEVEDVGKPIGVRSGLTESLGEARQARQKRMVRTWLTRHVTAWGYRSYAANARVGTLLAAGHGWLPQRSGVEDDAGAELNRRVVFVIETPSAGQPITMLESEG